MSGTPDPHRSHSAEMLWPALPSADGAVLLSMLHQLERSERWPAERIREHQLRQIGALLRHARATVPFYRERLRGLPESSGPIAPGDFHALPLVTRRDLQAFEGDLVSDADPARFGGAATVHTSGSTGEPVRVRRTGLDRLMWGANTLRDHRWHERDLRGELAAIRVTFGTAGAPPRGTVSPSWGPPTDEVWNTGPSALLDLNTDIGAQLDWLQWRDPHYLMTFPSNLAALIDRSLRDRFRPLRLREVRTVGETVAPELRAAAREHWDVPLVDVYSSNELGTIAIECPASGQYHVMSESVLVEVLDDEGRECAPGEIGRVVVTALHSFATPLVRYDVGDYAERGTPCACGRGLPTLARIVGRERNLVTLPDGRRHWPLVGFARFRDVAPVVQYQMVQTSVERIEVRLVVERAPSADEEAALARVIHEALGHPFEISFRYLDDRIPRGPGHKFEEFQSLL